MTQRQAMIRTRQTIDEFDRGNGVVTRLFCNEDICGAQVVILAGSAEAEFQGRRRPVGVMEVAYIPAGEVHCFHNVGDEPVLMLFIYDAGEVTRTFAATGETVVHLAAGDRAQPGKQAR